MCWRVPELFGQARRWGLGSDLGYLCVMTVVRQERRSGGGELGQVSNSPRR